MKIVVTLPKKPSKIIYLKEKIKNENIEKIEYFNLEAKNLLTYGDYYKKAKDFLMTITSALESGATTEEVLSALTKFAAHTKADNAPLNAADVLSRIYHAYLLDRDENFNFSDLTYILHKPTDLGNFRNLVDDNIMETVFHISKWLKMPNNHYNAQPHLALIK